MKLEKFKHGFYTFITDAAFMYTFFALLLKCFFFLALMANDNSTVLQLFGGYKYATSKIIYIFFILLFLCFSYLFKGKGHAWYLLLLNVIFSIFFVVDLLYYRSFNTVPSFYLLKQTANLDNLSDSIFAMFHPIDVVFVLDLIVEAIVLIWKRKHYDSFKKSVPTFLIIFLLACNFTIFVPLEKDIFGFTGPYTYLFEMKWKPSITINRLSPIGYHLYDMYTYFKDSKKLVLNSNDQKNIRSWLMGKNENLPDNKYKGMFKGKNLLIIQWESLEQFAVDERADNQEITPNLNKLLNSSMYFNNYFEQVNEGTSSDADLMTNTSVYPLRQGSTFFRYPDDKYKSLPKLFESMGYSTKAIHPDKGAFWNWMPALKSIGFQKCYDSTSYKNDEIIGLGLSDASFLRQIEPLVEKSKQPFYDFVVTLTSHSPFNLPQNKRTLKLDKKLDSSHIGGYFQSLHYTDAQLGIFLNKLDKSGLLDNTVVVIYGDHTGIHKYHQTELDTQKDLPKEWTDPNKRIPLIIYSKGYKPETISTNCGQVDLMPTLCYLFGMNDKDYKNYTMGKNMLNTNMNFTILTNGQVVGNAKSHKALANAQRGLDVADKIIRSNFMGTAK